MGLGINACIPHLHTYIHARGLCAEIEHLPERVFKVHVLDVQHASKQLVLAAWHGMAPGEEVTAL